MRRICRACGHAVSPNAAWCPGCGAKLYRVVPRTLIIGLVMLIVVILLLLALAVWMVNH